MSYKLKPGIENFQVVDGAFAGRKFRKGFLYAEIPPEEARKFEEVADEAQTPKTKSATKNKSSDASSTGGEEAKL
jgi:hypothetical protein